MEGALLWPIERHVAAAGPSVLEENISISVGNLHFGTPYITVQYVLALPRQPATGRVGAVWTLPSTLPSFPPQPRRDCPPRTTQPCPNHDANTETRIAVCGGEWGLPAGTLRVGCCCPPRQPMCSYTCIKVGNRTGAELHVCNAHACVWGVTRERWGASMIAAPSTSSKQRGSCSRPRPASWSVAHATRPTLPPLKQVPHTRHCWR